MNHFVQDINIPHIFEPVEKNLSGRFDGVGTEEIGLAVGKNAESELDEKRRSAEKKIVPEPHQGDRRDDIASKEAHKPSEDCASAKLKPFNADFAPPFYELGHFLPEQVPKESLINHDSDHGTGIVLLQNILNNARKDPKRTFNVSFQGQQEKSSNKVHTLSISERRMPLGIGIQYQTERFLAAQIKL